MKNLIQYINEHQEFISEYCDMLDQINLEIITESFGCQLLKDLVKQQCDLLEKWKDYQASNRYASMTKPMDINHLFRNSQTMWNKITDDQVQTFKGADPEGVKLFKRVCSNRSNSVTGFIVIETTENERKNTENLPKYSGIILKEWSWIKYYPCRYENSSKEIKPTEAIQLLTSDTTYHIIILDDVKSRRELQNERSRSRSGVIEPGNVDQLKRLAQENIERYRKIAAKMKIEKQVAAEKLPEQVNECVKKVMDLAIEFAKNPIKYSKMQYEIGKLMELVGDKEVGYYDRGKYHKYGINGLMYYFSSYLKSKLSLASGNSYGYEQKDYDNAKKKLEEMIDKINKSYDEIIKKAEQTTTEV